MNFFEKLLGTLQLRPYVFVFLLVYIVHATYFFTWRKCLMYALVGYLTAWGCEWGSIHFSFPFGSYKYIETTKDIELWVFGVPFFDSLSFIFLGYFSAIAGRLWLPRDARRIWQVLIGGGLMMYLDIIIDPLTLQGEKWFLGKIYYYPEPGPYFGVTLENFWGWGALGVLLGIVSQLVFGSFADRPHPLFRLSSLAVFFGIAAFNLVITFHIGDAQLGWVGVFLMIPIIVHFVTRPKELTPWS